MKVAIVIPAYNEAKMIAEVVKEVRGVTPHVFVVDDGSSDETAACAQTAGATVLVHALNRGQGAALRTGLEAALQSGADIIVTFDADGQMSVADTPTLTAPIEAGLCDVVLGSRFMNLNLNKKYYSSEAEAESRISISRRSNFGMPTLRLITLKAALLFTRATTGLKLTDTHNGLRAFSREAAAKLDLRCDRMAHASEILEEISRLNLRYREVPVTIKYTNYSLAKGQKLSGAFRIVRDLVLSSWVK
jgi:glycosyltransferase involved in cell wall biosynthesis